MQRQAETQAGTPEGTHTEKINVGCCKEIRWLGMNKQAGTGAGNTKGTHNKRQPTNAGQ